MSKQKKKKTKKHQIEKKKKSSKKTVIAVVCVAITVALIIAGAIIADRLTNLKYVDFVGRGMKSVSAYNAKGKEVDLREVYINADRYDNYQGTLALNEDATFSLWMGPGPDDGTHDGTFTYDRGEETINVEYKSGDKAAFKVVRNKDGSLNHIEAPYQDYTIYFSSQ